MFAKLRIRDIILLLFALFIPVAVLMLARFINKSAQEKRASRNPVEWKKALKPVGFKGTVSDKSHFGFSERAVFSIELKNVTIENEKVIPKSCDFFEYKNGVLTFAAYAETVSRWPSYGLEEGDIIEKKTNNDTLFVYTPDYSPKYAFELFDGIIDYWTPRQWPISQGPN